MANTVNGADRFKLRVRIRSRKQTGADLNARLDLIDRIADLQGIHVAERNDDTLPCRVDVHLLPQSGKRNGNGGDAPLLCSLSREGITINGLDYWARHQVLACSWGVLNRDSVRVYMPRDDKELETVWQIVRRAYDNRQSEPGRDSGAQVTGTWDWPKFSRTSLQ